MDEFLEVNLDTEDEPRQTFISRNMLLEEKEVYINCLKKIGMLLAWTYTEVPGFDLKNIHALPICRPRQTVSKTVVEMDAPRPIFQNRSRS